ncbi:MarR family winged helix-turn-helix transcriptional regulator [Aestuariivirga sp.]|uniref:MarR family winged helix-turn-helix transcriptional regulator n=1 Tax=Aestuariivirga sp. TaxID=2650926 RepID=UPI0037834FFE
MAKGTIERSSVPGGYRLEDQIGFHLRRANQRHTTIFAACMPDELTPTQWAALVRLAELESLSQNLLGRETAMDAATIKGVVDRLLRRGLVETRPDPHDGRRMLVAITASGREAVRRGVGPGEQISAQTLKPLSPPERKLLLDLLRRIS